MVSTTWALSFNIHWSLVGFVISTMNFELLYLMSFMGVVVSIVSFECRYLMKICGFEFQQMNFEHQKLWIQNVASMEVEHWQRLQQVSIVEPFIQVSTSMEFQQRGVLTIVTTLTMKSFPNYNKGGASCKVFILNQLSFLSLPTKWSSFPNHGKVRIFFPHFKLWPNFMGSIPLVLLVFFYIMM